MNQVQEYKLNKFLDFRDYVLQNPLTLEQNPLLKPPYEAFLNCLNLILKTREMMYESMKFNSNYVLLKEDLIKVALSVSRKVTAYSLLEELTELQGMFCYTYEELSQETDEKILKKCQNILQFMQNFKTELSDYGIDTELDNKLRGLTDQFHLTMESKNLYKDPSIVSYDGFNHLINELEEIFENKLLSINENIVLKPS